MTATAEAIETTTDETITKGACEYGPKESKCPKEATHVCIVICTCAVGLCNEHVARVLRRRPSRGSGIRTWACPKHGVFSVDEHTDLYHIIRL